MKTYLMCEPKFFEVSYDINPWMSTNIGKVDQDLANKQWKNLHGEISKRAHVKLIDPINGLPDMVFTANAGLVKDDEVIVSSFRHDQRVGESHHFDSFFNKERFKVKSLNPIIFEGAGDALFDHLGELWLGSGPRSDPSATVVIESVMNVKVNSLHLIDPRWYHLDTVFCPLDRGYVLAYKSAFSIDSINKIQDKFKEKTIWISDEDAGHFACNAVGMGDDIILNRASVQLKSTLDQHGFKVTEVDVSEFMKSGGSCKCLTLEI